VEAGSVVVAAGDLVGVDSPVEVVGLAFEDVVVEEPEKPVPTNVPGAVYKKIHG